MLKYLLIIIPLLSISFANEKLAKEIHSEIITLDTHVDIDTDYFTEKKHLGMKTDQQVDIPKMQAGGLNAAFFIVYTAQYLRNEEGYKKAYTRAKEMFSAIRNMTNKLNQNEITLIEKYSDIKKAQKSKKLMAFIGVENAFPISDDLSRVDEFYKLGARYISLTHNGHSQFGDSHTKKLDKTEEIYGGVSPLGKKLIRKLNDVGIMIDVSHSSKKTMMDIIRLSRAPVIASHSAVRKLRDHSRNLDDEQLRALKKNGGVIQVVAFQSYLKKTPAAKSKAYEALREKYKLPKGPRKYLALKLKGKEVENNYWKESKAIGDKYMHANVSDFVDHIDHVVKIAGIDHVGISSDFGGGGGIKGWNDASETFNVTLELVKRGYNKKQIEKIWSGNLLRVFKKVEELRK